ncbi:hypothetical protein EK21DRAFT_84742 [Setomelanomma holmii]|uniref:Uncharacterized protein n=1 Tax=Setomelanomma holmii TaxID=210430 RepID=A0A9P4HKB9_9PLEO|nr:hypothetical protein EK21DRAFT_84742 [Setomelanomma holmii]
MFADLPAVAVHHERRDPLVRQTSHRAHGQLKQSNTPAALALPSLNFGNSSGARPRMEGAIILTTTAFCSPAPLHAIWPLIACFSATLRQFLSGPSTATVVDVGVAAPAAPRKYDSHRNPAYKNWGSEGVAGLIIETQPRSLLVLSLPNLKCDGQFHYLLAVQRQLTIGTLAYETCDPGCDQLLSVPNSHFGVYWFLTEDDYHIVPLLEHASLFYRAPQRFKSSSSTQASSTVSLGVQLHTIFGQLAQKSFTDAQQVTVVREAEARGM